jgi:tripartite-type tricarboxylate transporter receptor subunit TctC
MKLARRSFLHLAAGAAAFPASSLSAWAQTYPSRPVRLIVGLSPGSGSDITARLIGQWLAQKLGQPFVVENRVGAGGNVGAEAVVHAPADGYTLLLVTAAYAFNATLYDKPDFNFIRDIAPVASLVRTPLVMAVNPSVPAKTVPEFIAYAKANAGKVSMATNGVGSVQHIAGALFMAMTGVDLTPVHYRGDPAALNDLIGGQVQVIFDPLPPSLGFIKAGKLRPLGVTTATRLDVLPDVPPIGDFVPGYLAGGWLGIGAPKGTPVEIIDRLNGAINASLADPGLRTRLVTDLGSAIQAGSPADFGKFIADETEKWGKVIRASNIKAE